MKKRRNHAENGGIKCGGGSNAVKINDLTQKGVGSGYSSALDVVQVKGMTCETANRTLCNTKTAGFFENPAVGEISNGRYIRF